MAYRGGSGAGGVSRASVAPVDASSPLLAGVRQRSLSDGDRAGNVGGVSSRHVVVGVPGVTSGRHLGGMDSFYARRVGGAGLVATDVPAVLRLRVEDVQVIAEQVLFLLKAPRVSDDRVVDVMSAAGHQVHAVLFERMQSFSDPRLRGLFVERCRHAFADFAVRQSRTGMSKIARRAIVTALKSIEERLGIDDVLDLNPKDSYSNHVRLMLRLRSWVFSATVVRAVLKLAREDLARLKAAPLVDHRKLLSFLLHILLVSERCSANNLSYEDMTLGDFLKRPELSLDPDLSALKKIAEAVLNHVSPARAIPDVKLYARRKLEASPIGVLICADHSYDPFYQELATKLRPLRTAAIVFGVLLALGGFAAAIYAATRPFLPGLTPGGSSPTPTPGPTSSPLPVAFNASVGFNLTCADPTPPATNVAGIIEIVANQIIGPISVTSVTGGTVTGCGNPPSPPSGGFCNFAINALSGSVEILVSSFVPNPSNPLNAQVIFQSHGARSVPISAPFPANCSAADSIAMVSGLLNLAGEAVETSGFTPLVGLLCLLAIALVQAIILFRPEIALSVVDLFAVKARRGGGVGDDVSRLPWRSETDLAEGAVVPRME